VLAVWTALAVLIPASAAADSAWPAEPRLDAQAGDTSPCPDAQPDVCRPTNDDGATTMPVPCWAFGAQGGGMQRSPSHSVSFAAYNPTPAGVTPGPPAPTVVVSTSELPYDFATTGTFSVARSLGDCLQLEAIFTGAVSTSNSEAARDNTPNPRGGIGDLYSPFSNFGQSTPINGLDYNKFAAIDYTSDFNSVELNLRRRVSGAPWDGGLTLLCGLRYVGLPENLSYQTESDITRSGTVVTNGATNDIHVATSNDMLGVQIGCLCEFCEENGWCLDIGVKAGLLNNHCGETSTYINVNSGTTTGYVSNQSGNHTSLAGELNVALCKRWSPHFTGILGYQALWLTGTALAQDNFNTNIAFYTSLDTQLAHSTLITYNEIYVGAQFDW
jgi:hypothetical protein